MLICSLCSVRTLNRDAMLHYCTPSNANWVQGTTFHLAASPSSHASSTLPRPPNKRHSTTALPHQRQRQRPAAGKHSRFRYLSLGHLPCLKRRKLLDNTFILNNVCPRQHLLAIIKVIVINIYTEICLKNWSITAPLSSF